ncbi:MAG: Mut7-C ubiquitin/RNAse domain-containing protein [Desulfobulbaceae bacterium]|nr:Mut7-C ubiquitin/RNAse domain-containing protein [Desulfobulbaceae bacterium]
MAAIFEFHDDLSNLLRPRWRNINPLVQTVTRRASIKDVIESFGLPHTEIGKIELEGREVDFTFSVADNQFFRILPVPVPWDVTEKSLLRPDPLTKIRFIVDVNVGRLARYLRMVGLDVLYNSDWNDEEITAMIVQAKRIVLTRDFGLLKRKQVEFGRYVRSDKPAEQLNEIITLFGLREKLKPFSRCLDCNSLLETVDKKDVLPRLEPLTRKYYNTFSICAACDKVYWAGSHIEEMRQFFPQF